MTVCNLIEIAAENGFVLVGVEPNVGAEIARRHNPRRLEENVCAYRNQGNPEPWGGRTPLHYCESPDPACHECQQPRERDAECMGETVCNPDECQPCRDARPRQVPQAQCHHTRKSRCKQQNQAQGTQVERQSNPLAVEREEGNAESAERIVADSGGITRNGKVVAGRGQKSDDAHPRGARDGVGVRCQRECDRPRRLFAPLHGRKSQNAHARRFGKEDPGTRSRPLEGLIDGPNRGRLDVAECRCIALCTASADVDVPCSGGPEHSKTDCDYSEQDGLNKDTTYHKALLSMRHIVANSCSFRPCELSVMHEMYCYFLRKNMPLRMVWCKKK